MIVSVLSVLLVFLTVYIANHRLSGWQLALAVFVGLFGVVLVSVPQLTSRLASLLGVGRGTDLLLYFAIMGGLFVSAHFYFRFKKQERDIVEVVRALAIANAATPSPASRTSGKN